MRGITEKAVKDIYMHILNVSLLKSVILCFIVSASTHSATFAATSLILVWTLVKFTSLQTPEREFRIKISGLEIYNENVRDLLNSESGRNLKLLDDPEVNFQKRSVTTSSALS